MSLLNWFEQTTGRTYPKDAKEMIEFTLEKGITIEFTFENYGTYEVLDFNKLSDARNGNPVDSGDQSNPYSLMGWIGSYLEEYFPKEKMQKLLPFARANWGDKTWHIFFTKDNEYPVLANIDSETFKPVRSKNSIAKYISLDKLDASLAGTSQRLKFDNVTLYTDIVPQSQTYITDGEGIAGVESYKELIENTLKIADGKFSLTSFSGEEKNGVMRIVLKINDKIKGEMELRGDTDWIDSGYVQQLNHILRKHLGKYGFSEFRDSGWGQEFGVLYASLDKIEELKVGGFIRG